MKPRIGFKATSQISLLGPMTRHTPCSSLPSSLPSIAYFFVNLSYLGSKQFIIARVYDFLWYFMQHFQNSHDCVFACQHYFFFHSESILSNLIGLICSINPYCLLKCNHNFLRAGSYGQGFIVHIFSVKDLLGGGINTCHAFHSFSTSNGIS